jgi:hypothetical protein
MREAQAVGTTTCVFSILFVAGEFAPQYNPITPQLVWNHDSDLDQGRTFRFQRREAEATNLQDPESLRQVTP